MSGSSPLTRGKPAVPNHDMAPVRLIPAHAGKTCRTGGRRALAPAHPRSRGENRCRERGVAVSHGSSPLTRGKPDRRAGGLTGLRLIPAHAGKTGSGACSTGILTAHPRSRGENASACQSCSECPGSSPLTRGKQPDHHPTRNKLRLIPAHAGKTGDDPGAFPRVWAHPRSRGENNKE